MQAVINPVASAAIGTDSAKAAVAAHPIEEKASANVASRDDVWRRRNWLRRACTRNQSWIAVAEAEAIPMPEAGPPPRRRDANTNGNPPRAHLTPPPIHPPPLLPP